MKLISVVTPCYNEEENIEEIYKQVKAVFAQHPQYHYEHIFIDNASTDRTVSILKSIVEKDKNIRVILNARNFGQVRSPFHGLLQAKGDAAILIVADLQDPPTLISDFLQKWEAGHKIVIGVKPATKEKFPLSVIRRYYYYWLAKISETKPIQNFTGFGLYDKSIIHILQNMKDVNPYFRGLISEIGFPVAQIPFVQPMRQRGISKNNFFTLYDMAMLGITTHSKLPIRLATTGGFLLSVISLIFAAIFLVAKLLFWNHFPVGIAPILIGLFFFTSIQLFFIGILGEYILSIHAQVLKRPLVIEQERINFE
jgi:glycosyltransferase involved in cell wall biosynthesis